MKLKFAVRSLCWVMFSAILWGQSSSKETTKTGTGFAITATGKLLTNYHVVEGCTSVTVGLQGQAEPAQVLAFDQQNDLALLTLPHPVSTWVSFRDSRLKLGESVLAAGYPLHGIVASSLNVTTGGVSALAGLTDDTRMVQFTAPVQPGNSGGPLLDQGGILVGIVTSKLSPLIAQYTGDLPQNVNFAIKSSVVREFLDSRGVAYRVAPPSPAAATTDIAERVASAIYPVQCLSEGSSSPAEQVEKSGVLLGGYGSPIMSFQRVVLDLMNFLATSGVAIANRPHHLQIVRGDEASVNYFIEELPKIGARGLIYLTVVQPRARLQYFDARGNLRWEEAASSKWHFDSDPARVADELKKKLRSHIKQGDLPLRRGSDASEMPNSIRDGALAEARPGTQVPNPLPPPRSPQPQPSETPASAPRSMPAVTAPPASSPTTTLSKLDEPPKVVEGGKTQPVEPEAKPEMTVTSDPRGASVEINGVAVGTTPVTVVLAKGTKFDLAVRKDGYVLWVTHAEANYGKFTMNANLTKQVFR